MKGDFTRNTFDPAKHYRDVLLQQGRAQVDADWNEQAELTARRDETTAADIVGDCGGPADGAAFGVFTAAATLSALEQQHLKDLKIPALGQGDFYLSAGRYYVDGIQCENEWAIPFTAQPDRLDVAPLVANKTYLLYLDVWQRHISALEDDSIRESALGGPDTATRVKTICQVYALDVAAAIDPNNPCNSGSAAFNSLFDPGTARLTADTATTPTPKDPCLVPPSAGFTGLENQLYRVEIHDPAQWKWSRENGSVVTRILGIDHTKIKVGSLGPDKNLGFVKDAWVEILDDALELQGNPGQLAQIDDVDEANGVVTLKTPVSSLVPPDPIKFPAGTYPDGVVPERHPKLRRWEGVAPLQTGKWLPLESGVQVNFAAAGSYRTGHFWQIPARTATAQSPNGEIEWPVKKGNRLALAPRGVKHHFCRLGILTVKNDYSIDAIDCRCLWPALTHVPRLFYVSGDGQEVMPDLTKPNVLVPLAAPLIVGIANLHANSKVRFTITKGNGQIDGNGKSVAGLNASLDVKAGADGLAICNFALETASHHQQVTARGLDPACGGTPLPIIFNANLSEASEVAYDPGECKALKDHKNVQDAISGLAALVRIDKVSGDGQDTDPGQPVPNELSVLVSSLCGPVKGANVQFTATHGFLAEKAADLPSSNAQTLPLLTDGNGIAACHWRTATTPTTQELSAAIAGLPGALVMEDRKLVRFTANLRTEGADCCCVTVGQGGQFERLDLAIQQLLLEQKRTDICICLMPGNHQLPEGLKIESVPDRGVCVKISGCGLACRLSMDNKQLAALNLASFALTDLCLIALNQAGPAITIENCALVSITGCYFFQQQKGDPHDLLTIVRAHRIIVADNIIESYWGQETRMKALGIETPAVFEPGAFDALVRQAAQKLATGGEKARREFVKAFRATLPKKGTKDLRTRTVDLEGILDQIDSVRDDGKDESETIAEFAVLVSQVLMAPAVSIADANADVSIVDNIITGEVLIYGTTGGALPADFDNLAVRIKDRRVTMGRPTTRSLRLEGNSLTNVVMDSGRVPAPPKNENGGPILNWLFARMSVLDNSFHSIGNQWLADHVILNGNHFLMPDNGTTVGTATGASFICTGTSADMLPARLEYGVPAAPPNDPTQPPRFSQSANLINVVSV
jgi:hypothetical protein